MSKFESDIAATVYEIASLEDGWDGNSSEWEGAWATVDLTQVTLADMLDYTSAAGVDPVELEELRGYWLVSEAYDGHVWTMKDTPVEVDAMAARFGQAYEDWVRSDQLV